MRRVTTSVASTCFQIQKSHSSTALARKPIETPPAPARWSRAAPAPSKWAARPDPIPRPVSVPPNRSWQDRSASASGSGSRDSQGSTSTRARWSRPGTTNDQNSARAHTPSRYPLQPRGASSSQTATTSQNPALRRPPSPQARPLVDELSVLTLDEEETRPRSRHNDGHDREKRNRPRRMIHEFEQAAQQPTQAQPVRKPKKSKPVQIKVVPKDVFIPSAISVGNLAKLLKVKRERLDDVMYDMEMGRADFDRVIKADDACLIAMELNFNPIVDDVAAFDIYPETPAADKSALPTRPPIVTIMGHVDHGKTTLLDTLRSASVAAGESGGITQHIGAFSVPLKSLSVQTSSASSEASKTVTFLDTPGHAAFSAMRARGANVTNIIVLVVAADDGIMPQTREVIELSRKDSNTQLIVAINKCDKPGVDVTAVKHALLAEGVELEEFGGEIPSVEVSGLTGLGLDRLMETIIAVAEVSDLRAEKDLRAHGHVLEARMEKGKGPIATVLITRGTLNRGDSIVGGLTWAKVRQMTDDKGKPVSSAAPGTPVTVAGWKELPVAGDEVLASAGKNAADDVKRAIANRIRERDAAALVEDMQSINDKRRAERERRDEINAMVTVDGSGRKIRPQWQKDDVPASAYVQTDDQNGPKELKIIVKADVSGTVEAVVESISYIGNKEAKVRVINSGVGDVTDSDIAMASSTQAMVLGFNVSVPRGVEAMASQSGVPIHVDSVIYRLIEDVTQRVTSLLPKIIETRVVGEANVQQLFSIKKGKEQMNVAGCRVINGTLEKHKTARVVRNGETVAECKLNELKHLKTDVKEVRKGMECGLTFESFADFQEGDLIQAYEIIEKNASL